MRPSSYVLLTAMPPTKGHRALLEFANFLGPLHVVLCTQPDEPFVVERIQAVKQMVRDIGANVSDMCVFTDKVQQEPYNENDKAFWRMWRDKLVNVAGFKPGDYIVASEKYGKPLAEVVGGVFMPFDIERSILPCKASIIRSYPVAYHNWIDTSFQGNLHTTITIFGAESTGKTTLSKRLADNLSSFWLPEYARPYLENTVNEVTDEAMKAIWRGQRALQQLGRKQVDKAFTIQDTDLYSTIGYWEMAPWDLAGAQNVPMLLRQDAERYMSDLYIITPSNIPFEQDPLRYGGTIREVSDAQWVSFCEENSLPYVLLETCSLDTRLEDASVWCHNAYFDKCTCLAHYQREGREYFDRGVSVG